MKPEHVELIVKTMGLNESSAERLKNMSNTKDEIVFKPDQLSQLIDAIEAPLNQRIAELRDELEIERCRLAACGVAALGYVEGCKEEYKSASLDDVLRMREKLTELERENAALNGANLPPIEGDRLPQIGSTVEIHLARADAWVKHEVVGYYVLPDLSGNKYLHRVFVRVRDQSGYENARLLCDIRGAN